MKNSVPVLIVGAGPTGLLTACELARHGIPCRIIDKKTEPTLASNAAWIQTRTLEIFEQIGIADQFIRAGQVCTAINLYAKGKHIAKIQLDQLDSTYSYAIMLAQSETEKILTKLLTSFGITIEWHTELLNIEQSEGKVSTQIKHIKGEIEEFNCNWLIACDGANSTVRQASKQYFPGEDLKEQFIVADAIIDSPMSKHEIHLFFDENCVFQAQPLDSYHYRISANLNLSYPRKIFSEKEIIELAQERAYGNYYVKSVNWISPFWVHSKVVSNMRDQAVFFVGDAAHTLSPASGQGMNTGLLDAHNLAWKLAMVIKGKAQPLLLDTYQSERHPVVSNIVDTNEKYTKMALFDTDFLDKVAQFGLTASLKPKEISTQIASYISQTNICYKDSAAIDTQHAVRIESPHQGERAPDVKFKNNSHLYATLRNTKHNIFLFTDHDCDEALQSKIIEFHKLLTQDYDNDVSLHTISTIESNQLPNLIRDEDEKIHQRYKIKKPSIFIIRPDGYISYFSETIDYAAVHTFLQRYLK